MSERARIEEQLQRAFEGEAWHGPSVREVLVSIPPVQAAEHPLPAAHSIWEIVLHMTTWHDTVRRRLAGEAFMPTPAQDWPTVTDTSESAWRAALADLDRSYRDVRSALASLDESRLDEALIPGGSTGYVQLHGLVQHDLYHAGQIAVLRKG
jgi:uncharacterized damage-inducible protein DinB